MAVNQTKLTGGGEVGEVTVKKTKLSKLKSKFKAFNFKQRILLVIGVVVIVMSLGTVVYRYYNPTVDNGTITPMESQTVDPAALDKALQQYQQDPSSIPSGEFKPDFKIDDSNSSNTGQAQ